MSMKKFRIFLALLTCLLILISCGCGKEETEQSSTLSSNNIENNDGKVEDKGYVELVLDEKSSAMLLTGTACVKESQGDFTLYFGDENGKALQGYTKIADTENKTAAFEDLVVPPMARTIVASCEGKSYFVSIPKENLILSEDVFVFGTLSDVHFNKYFSSENVDDAIISFDRALDYFEEIGVDLVGITGDITNNGEEDSLIKYNEAIEQRPFPVFTVTGNHDVSTLNNGLWKKYISDNVENCTFAENGLDFIYMPQGENGDMYIFLNQVRWEYNTSKSALLEAKQILWLNNILRNNTDKQVYLFFHTFLCGPDGQKHTGVGNIMNPGGYTYPLPFTYNNSDERLFRKLLKENKNIVFFSGHSHWMFEMEIYGEQTNFSDFEGEYCTMVHVPSVTAPRYIGDNDTNRKDMNGFESQGWVLYDYGDITVLVPVDFVNGVFYTEYMEIING